MSNGSSKRTAVLMTIIIVAAIGALIGIFVAGNNSSTSATSKVTDVSLVNSMLSGIPQQGTILGSSSAPVTMYAYEDLKCPICQNFNLNVFPTLISKYVKTGQMKVEYIPQTFVGQAAAPGDSARAAKFALAAAEQSKFWNFAELFYHNQQDENSTYVTNAFLTNLGKNVPGLNVNKALSDMNSSQIASSISAASSQFTQAGFTGTPSFQLSKNGSTPTALKVSTLSVDQFTGPIDQLLAQQ